MSSAAQIKANRRNGARSRGPVSEAGKKRASRNRLVYTIKPRSFIAPGEDQVAFRDMARTVLDHYPPRTRFERRIVHRLIAQNWQRDRLLRIEQAMLGDREAVCKLPLALRPVIEEEVGLEKLSMLTERQIQLDAAIRESVTLIIELQHQPVLEEKLASEQEPGGSVQSRRSETHRPSPVAKTPRESGTAVSPAPPSSVAKTPTESGAAVSPAPSPPSAGPTDSKPAPIFTMQAPRILLWEDAVGPAALRIPD